MEGAIHELHFINNVYDRKWVEKNELYTQTPDLTLPDLIIKNLESIHEISYALKYAINLTVTMRSRS